jgi:SAM-dependent methyltransferase
MDDTGVDLQLDRPHSARMYDYYLGGSTNFPADREAVGRVMAAFPQVLAASRANRAFMHRSTEYLAGRGLRQFLDIGTGIPTRPNLHEIAQAVAPDARIVYVDNDPIVLAHAQALLLSNPAGRTAYVQADLRDPAAILASPALRDTLDLSRPVALSLNAVLPFVPDEQVADEIVNTLKDALAPGSALVISHGTGDFSPTLESLAAVYRSVGTNVQMRTAAGFARFFDGWDLVDPGVTLTYRWHPDSRTGTNSMTDQEASCYVAVAYKIS